jgi:hypothetical protein
MHTVFQLFKTITVLVLLFVRRQGLTRQRIHKHKLTDINATYFKESYQYFGLKIQINNVPSLKSAKSQKCRVTNK